MKNKMMFLYGGLALLLLITGIIVYKAVSKPNTVAPPVVEEFEIEEYPQADSAITVDVQKIPASVTTVRLTVSGLDAKYSGIGYDFTYDSNDISKGVNSGNIPVDVTGKSNFIKEIVLGTCSRNVCTSDPNVTSVSVLLVFTDSEGNKSQLSKDFDL